MINDILCNAYKVVPHPFVYSFSFIRCSNGQYIAVYEFDFLLPADVVGPDVTEYGRHPESSNRLMSDIEINSYI